MKRMIILIVFVLVGIGKIGFAKLPGPSCSEDLDCKDGQKCLLGHCIWIRSSVNWIHGCCYGRALLSGNGKYVEAWNCSDSSWKVCGWDVRYNEYTCVDGIDSSTTFYQDPDGKYPRECDFTCKPDCEGKECGPDGCGGSCGKCGEGQVCNPKTGKCCTPHCEGKECGGDNGCGGDCGECKDGQVCLNNKCYWKGAIPIVGCCHNGLLFDWSEGIKDCKKKGEICGWIRDFAYACIFEKDIDNIHYFREDPSGRHPKECDFTCKPDCEGKECGPDGCGGSCGECGVGQRCYRGKCCTPDCNGRECGDDGCGGSCGKCNSSYWMCDFDGKCHYDYGASEHLHHPGCPDCRCEKCVCERDPNCCYKEWNFMCAMMCQNECGGAGPCEPDCKDKECGDDGCGGMCGYCKLGYYCDAFRCKKCDTCDGYECGFTKCREFCGRCKENERCIYHKCVPKNDPCKGGLECDPWGYCNSCPEGQNCVDGHCRDCTKPEYKCRGLGGKAFDNCGNYCGGIDNSTLCLAYCHGYECGSDHCYGSCGECDEGYQCISHHCVPISELEPEVAPDTAEKVQTAEEMPDTAEDVQVEKDVIEVVDSGKTGKDVKGDGHGNGNHRDEKNAGDSIKDGQGIDNGSVPPMKPSGGGCTAGKGSSSGILLILMGILGLFFVRKHKSTLNRD